MDDFKAVRSFLAAFFLFAEKKGRKRRVPSGKI